MKEIEIEKCMGLSYPIPATNEGMERVWKPAVMFTAGNTDVEIEDSLKDKIGRVTTSIAVRED